MSARKYRPYLSLPMMERICALCNSHPIDELSQDILDSLQTMILKARMEITKPAFIPLAAKLGIPEPEFKPPQTQEEILEEQRFISGAMTPEEAQAYQSKLMAKITGSF